MFTSVWWHTWLSFLLWGTIFYDNIVLRSSSDPTVGSFVTAFLLDISVTRFLRHKIFADAKLIRKINKTTQFNLIFYRWWYDCFAVIKLHSLPLHPDNLNVSPRGYDKEETEAARHYLKSHFSTPNSEKTRHSVSALSTPFSENK